LKYGYRTERYDTLNLIQEFPDISGNFLAELNFFSSEGYHSSEDKKTTVIRGIRTNYSQLI